MVRAKKHSHRPTRKNKSCQTRSSPAIPPAKAQVPPGKHRPTHQHRKQQNDANDQKYPFAGGRLIRLHAFGAGPGANQLEVDGLAPVCRSLDPHRDIGALGQRPCPRSARVAITGGVHVGCAGGHLEGSSPAAENSGVQSGDDAAPAGFSTCGGTSMNCVRRPSGLSLSSVIPDTSSGGSSVHTAPDMGPSRGEGLSRQRPRAAAIPKHERPGLEVVPTRLRLVVFRDIA